MMTTAVQPSFDDTLGHIYDGLCVSADEAFDICSQLMEEATSATDPQLRKEARAKVAVLSNLSLRHIREIEALRQQAGQAYHSGNRDKAVEHLFEISDLISTSGLPGMALYLADIKTQLDTLVAQVDGNTRDITSLQRELAELKGRVQQLEGNPDDIPTDRLTLVPRTPHDQTHPVAREESFSDMAHKVRAWIKDNIGPQKYSFKDARARYQRSRPLHATR